MSFFCFYAIIFTQKHRAWEGYRLLYRYEGWLVDVTRRANCRRLILRARPDGACFSLSVPPRATRREIDAFLAANRAFMERAARETLSAWQPAYAAGERHLLLGRRVTLGRDGVPAGEAFRRQRTEALRQLVALLLPKWQERMGVRCAAVRWRDMRSRWGSCTPRTGEIRLNVRLALVPEACVEYVLVHELNHLTHPDHSPAFHADMTRFLPDWKARKSTLDHLDIRPLPPDAGRST